MESSGTALIYSADLGNRTPLDPMDSAKDNISFKTPG
jgi:hypothetical protein